MTTETADNVVPRTGMLATVRHRRGVVAAVEPYDYLRQPDVLEQFLAACRTPDGSPHLPWDLLIVDECHNLMPSPFGEDSELCRMLRLVVQAQLRDRVPHDERARARLTPLRQETGDDREAQQREATAATVPPVRDGRRRATGRTNTAAGCSATGAPSTSCGKRSVSIRRGRSRQKSSSRSGCPIRPPVPNAACRGTVRAWPLAEARRRRPHGVAFALRATPVRRTSDSPGGSTAWHRIVARGGRLDSRGRRERYRSSTL